MPGEEPLHRRHGLDHRADPWLPLRAWPGRSSSRCRTRSSRTWSFGSCPIYEPEVQSASIGAEEQPPILLYSDPERLLEHLGDDARDRGGAGHGRGGGLGRGAGPGHRPFRRAPAAEVAGRDVGLRGERVGAGGDPDRHVRQRDGRRRTLPSRQVQARARPQHAELPGRQLHLPGPVLTRQRTVPRLRPGVARHGDDVQGSGRPGHHRRASPGALRTARRRAASPREGRGDRRRRRSRPRRRTRGRRGGDGPGRGLEPRSDRNLHPVWSTPSPSPSPLSAGSRPSTTGLRTSRRTSRCVGSPSIAARTRLSTAASSGAM